MSEQTKYIDTDQKALEINLNKKIYGTFAEIGAGQEVARYFFKVGAAAGTVAKSMSAYDKVFSDKIYGEEASGRYVCESRLYKMLTHEYSLMDERLSASRPETNFFVYADTVAAINYSKTIKGNGWLGLRFQLSPEAEPNDLILHVKMLDNSNLLQQQAIGVIGVNMIYACYHYTDDLEKFVKSLMDGLDGRLVIDMIRLNGPDFETVDDRLMTLYLVKHGHTEVAMFSEDGKSIHPSEFLYKHSLMVVRGHYRPPTVVSEDVFISAFNQFKQDISSEEVSRAVLMPELTLQNLTENGKIREEDFLARATLLNAMGKPVIISNCSHHQILINYLSDFKIKNLGLVIGIRELKSLIVSKYEQNQDGRLLVAFGELFSRNIKVYAYPAYDLKKKSIMSARNLEVPEGIRFLYKHLIDSKHIVEVTGFNEELLTIFPHELLKKIQSDEAGWENSVPDGIADLIKNQCLLDFPCQITDFEY